MTTPPVYEQPSFDEGKQKFTAGYFVLRGSGDYRDAICIQPTTNAGWAQWWGDEARSLVNSSIAYRGQLTVVAVPRGSQWTLTLSDQPNVRAADAHALPSNRAKAMEKALLPRQLSASRRSAANR